MKSDKEIARFWDNHSLADFEKDLVPAKGVVFVKKWHIFNRSNRLAVGV